MTLQSIDEKVDFVLGERRSTEREVMICRVALLHATATLNFCRVLNISRGGLMARVFHQIAVGDVVGVELKSGQLLPGSVSWARDDHVGVAFREPVDVDAALSGQNLTDTGYLPRLPRLEVDYRMRLRCGSRYHTGRLRDISQRGAQVQISGSLSPKDSVSFMLRELPPIPASVRWTRGTKLGIVFHQSVPLEPLVRWIQDRRADFPDIVPAGHAPPPPLADRLACEGRENG